MKIRLSILAATMSLLLLLACDNSTTAQVKNGVLDLDKSITVGQAFDNYRYFKHVQWKALRTDNGRRIVEVVGTVDLDSDKSYAQLKAKFRDLDVVFQFAVNMDDTFEIQAAGMRYTDLNGKYGETSETNMLSVLSTLKTIYSNEPFL